MSDRPGFALIVSLLMALILSLVGLGALAVGLRETAIARSVEHRHRARLTAEAGVIATAEQWSTRAWSDLEIGGHRPAPGHDAEITVVRVDSVLFLLRGDARIAFAGLSTGAAGRAALLIRTFHAGSVIRHFPAAVTVERGAWIEGGTIAAGRCPEDPALFGPVIVSGGALVDGAIVHGAPPEADPFPAALLAGIATARVGPGTIRPRPLAAGDECRMDPANWGATEPGHPCHGLLPIIHATGPLTVSGGSARGILVVDGDLVLTDELRFEGILLVRGRVVIRDGTVIDGVLRAGELVMEDGRIAGAPCDLDPLFESPALDRPFRPAGRWWVPVF